MQASPHPSLTKSRLGSLDLFALVNVACFIFAAILACLGDALGYRGPANLPEFAGYAFIIAVLALLMRRVFRGTRVGAVVLALTQLGISAHLLGGFVPLGGRRLYDAVFLGVGFDKYVHVLNGLAGIALTDALIARRDRPIVHATVIFLVMMGGGAVVELVEYGAFLFVPGAGVGGYENNMQDMLANAIGGGLFLLGCRASSLAGAKGSIAGPEHP